MATTSEPAARSNEKNSNQTARTRLVDAARAGWVNRLIDTSRRNNLLYYRPIPTSSIDIAAENTALRDLLGGKAVSVTALLPEGTDRPTRVLNIARKAQENSEEKGLQTLYLALGFASWTASDGGRDIKSAIYLLPVSMKRKGRELTALDVQLAGDPKVNPVLLHVLADEFNVRVNELELLDAVTPKETEGVKKEPDGAAVLTCYREAVKRLAGRLAAVPGASTDCSATISNFSFAKLAL